ncbi:GAF domain-containing sensor histidine kinase [Bacillus shivajii]|uniref:GAF domain-containing sensor histidine kinase n=1 Tax=Bacillus shivajii TaxID=1983719 RepID=UPI001CFB55D8|nr:GAF domain-containing sensor histidine kinase [Bacillus shivajii]UCZ55156.1 GAF domain-containing sensor histidine kinase [Bacillus shivajii]
MKNIKELDLLKLISEKLNKETDQTSLLQSVLEHLLSLTNLQTGWIFTFNDERQLQLGASSSLPEALNVNQKRFMCEGNCWCVERYQDGRLKEATNIIECKRIEDAITFKRGDNEGITHHASIPLRAGDNMYGILNVASPNKKEFTNEELSILESVAFQIGSALHRIELFENEKKLTVIEERNRLARDLHDQVNQLLFTIMYVANGTKSLTNDKEILNSLESIQHMSEDALSEMKSLIWQLKTDVLYDHLPASIKKYGVKIGLDIDINIENMLEIPEHMQCAFYTIAQEALNNIKKHTNCLNPIVTIKKTKEQWIMKIQDNGNGFTGSNNHGVGLMSMRERSKLIGGTCQISSKEGFGTTVVVTIPL